MKIKKFQHPSEPIFKEEKDYPFKFPFNFFRKRYNNNINWIDGDNYSNWQIRNTLGEGVKRVKYGSETQNQKNNGAYAYNNNLLGDINYFKYPENWAWYGQFLNLTKNNPEQYANWWKQYYASALESGKPMEWLSHVKTYIETGDWKPFTANGQTFNTADSFYDYETTDKKISDAHQINTGKTYVNPETNVTYKEVPEGYEEYEYDDYDNKVRNAVNTVKNITRIGPILDVRPIRKKTPIDPKHIAQAREDVLENINPESNPVDTGNPQDVGGPQETGGSAIKGTPGWLRGVGKVFGGIGKGISDLFKGDGKPISPFWSQFMRTINDNAFNLRNTEQLIRNMDVPLLNYTPVYRQVHGDYIAQQQAQREASRLRTSQPITANQQIQTATDLEGIQKGNQLIEQGNAKDAQMYWNTAEKAFQQSKENAAGWDAIANKNKQALSEFNNKIAELRYKAQKDNMQNWDTLLADMERRKWQKWDRDEYLKLQSQEELDNLYDTKTGQGADYEELKALREKMLGETDKAKLAELNKQAGAITDRMSARTIYNRLRRLGMYDESKFKDMFPAYNFGKGGILGHSNGGILAFLQKGGGFGVIAASSAGEGNPYLAQLGKKEKSTTSSSTSSTTSKDESEKTKDKLLTNIAETLKGINGLNSDVNILYQELTNFFDIQRYVGDFIDDPMQYYSMYIRALNRVNQVKQSAKAFDSAYKELETKHSLDSPAIDPNGYVYVGIGKTNEIKKVTPDEYLNNTDKYKLLRNSDLLYLRRNNPNYAFGDTYIDDISHSGTNIEDIYKFIKDILGKVGTDKQSRDTIIQQYGNGAVQGLQELNDLVQQGAANPETAKIIAGLTGTQTEVNTSIESQVERAKLALQTISSILPRNMYSLLLLHSGSKENVGKLLTSIVFQGLSTDTTFKINGITQLDEQGNPKSGTRASGSGNGSGSDKEPLKDQTLVAVIRGIGGTPGRIKLNEGTKSEMNIDVENYQIQGAYSPGGLDKILSETKIMGISDPRKIYFGDQLISSDSLGDVAYTGRGFSRVMLPIKSDGSPDFTILSRFETVCDNLRAQGTDPVKALGENATLEEKKKMGDALSSEGLYGLINSNGYPNLQNFGLFLLTEGITSSKSGIKQSTYVVQNDDKADKLQDILTQFKSNGEVAKKYELDRFSYWNPSDWGVGLGSYDKVFEGTIYIPINANELQADIATGNKLKDSDATQYEGEFQSARLRSQFVDREQ